MQVLFWLVLSASVRADPFPSLQLPHYEVIQEMREALYQLKFEESQERLRTAIDQTDGAVWATYQAIFHYAELIVARKTNPGPKAASFEVQSDEAIRLLERQVEREPDNPVWSLYLGAMYGLKAGVALGYQQAYWSAYRYGIRGVEIFEELRERYPDFYDPLLSSGILKIMIAQSSWFVRNVAALVLTTGSLEGGMADLEQVIQHGKWMREEARLVHIFLMWGDVPPELRRRALEHLKEFIKTYPGNAQVYFFIAQGYWKLGDYSLANRYALQGIHQMRIRSTQFTRQHQVALRAMLSRTHYRFLSRTRQFPLLLAITRQVHDPSGTADAYQAFALKATNRRERSERLARTTLAQLQDDHLSLPMFLSPFLITRKASLEHYIRKHVLEESQP